MIEALNGETILVDLDDVIGQFGEYIASRLSVRTGIKKTVDDYHTYEFHKYHDNASHETFIDEVIISEAFRVIQPIWGSIEALRMLKKLGYTIRIVTSRGAFPDAKKDTTNWLKLHGATFDSIDVVNPAVEKKSDIYQKYAQAGSKSAIFSNPL